MTKILDHPQGPAAMKRAMCHEARRRLGRFFQRNIVIAFEEWRIGPDPFNYETFVNGSGDLNEFWTPELVDYYLLLEEEECATQGEQGIQGDPGPQGEQGEPGPGSYPYIASGVSEGESYTSSSSWQQKLRVSFSATLGVRYLIQWYFEMWAYDDEDVEVRVELNDTTEIAFSHFKNALYASRWAQCNGGLYFATNLNGTINVDIDYRNGYGGNNKGIRRARIIVTRVDEAP